MGLFAPGVLWGLFGFTSLLRLNFEWLLLILTALSLSMANIVGYVKCKQDVRTKMSSGLQRAAGWAAGSNSTFGRALQSAGMSAMFGSSSGSGSSGGSGMKG